MERQTYRFIATSPTFSEPVDMQAGGVTLNCASSDRTLIGSGGPLTLSSRRRYLWPTEATCQGAARQYPRISDTGPGRPARSSCQ